MPRFCVTALEKFLVKTTYYTEAATAEEAEAKCKAGDVGYDFHEIQEGDDEWVETLEVEMAEE